MPIHRLWVACLAFAWVGAVPASAAKPPAEPLRISVYATAGDILRYLAADEERSRVLATLEPLRVARVFLEGRRGDEYVPPTTLINVRDFLQAQGIQCTGGIATVPGADFGVRQDAALGWLNWQNSKTQQAVARFFTENAPLFAELIVDDFYCTADTSPGSIAARGERSWGAYRRDLLVSLIEPMMLRPARAANPSVRLILKYPQWYDRFHLFGYDPARMSPHFDTIWVGTEVRDPTTRRMGYVQPTEGYMNFRWLNSVAREKVVGAWFDHIECRAQHFADQAYQSVLAGARELTLFRLGDLMDGHPGDALLATRLPDLFELAAKVRGRKRDGVVFYKPSGSPSDENMYLPDYLGMLGWPVLPEAQYPEQARVVFLGIQASADEQVLAKARAHLDRGATVLMTPAFIREVGEAAADLAAVQVGATPQPVQATGWRGDGPLEPLPLPLDVDAGVSTTGAGVRLEVEVNGRPRPLLMEARSGRGRVLVLNVRTFSEADFRSSGEWLLAPRRLGLGSLPEGLVNELRRQMLPAMDIVFEGPAGVGLYLFEDEGVVYSFLERAVSVRLNDSAIEVPAHGWRVVPLSAR